jgi:drug/metabolite transporter (DMT)-like permease
VNLPQQPAAPLRVIDLWPGIIAASSFAICNVLSKLVLAAGSDVLTLSVFRGLVGVALMFIWLRIGIAPPPHTARARWISLGLGILFAGVVFGLFAAISIVTVPVAILAYFVYPLFTGIVGALLGIERIGWRGALTAVTAFLGLALMIGASPDVLAPSGLAFAFGAATCRTAILLLTRSLLQDSDPQVTTWYLMLSSTAVLASVSLLTWNWQGPQTALGWTALVGVSIGTTISVLALFVSIKRIGPFRSALIMFLEPLLSTVLSAPVLGETITPVQAIGGAAMLTALVAFQLRR